MSEIGSSVFFLKNYNIKKDEFNIKSFKVKRKPIFSKDKFSTKKKLIQYKKINSSFEITSLIQK